MTPNIGALLVGQGFIRRLKNNNIYVFNVPNAIIKQAGGIIWHDDAPEIIIPEELWGRVKFLGKLRKRISKEFIGIAFRNYKRHLDNFNSNQNNQGETNEIHDHPPWSLPPR